MEREVTIERMRIAASAILFCCACSAPPPAPEPLKEEKPKHAKILQFYGADAEVTRGQPITLCYGVEDAVRVRMEPADEQLGLSRNRCIAVSPKQNTTYALIAKGADGLEVRQSLPIRVVAPRQAVVLIQNFDVSMGGNGQPVQLCYRTKGATTLRLDPPLHPVGPSETPRCIPVVISAPTTFILTATDAAGNVDRMQVTAKPN